MGNELVRPGDPQSPCIAIFGGWLPSQLRLVNLKDGSSSRVRISNDRALGIVTIGGEVYAVTTKEILKICSNGKKNSLRKLKNVDVYAIVVTFQKKIYIIQHGSMSCFDPANNSFDDNLPACGLGRGFCACASDDFIYAMEGEDTEYLAKKFDPSRNTWFEIPRMNQKRVCAAAATLDGKIYVMGGRDSWFSVEYYDPGNNTWTEISNMNMDRWNFCACVIGNQLYAVGGDSISKNGHYDSSIEVYNEDPWPQWMITTMFEHKATRPFACTWPHGSLKSGERPTGHCPSACCPVRPCSRRTGPRDITPRRPRDITPKYISPRDITPRDITPRDITPRDITPRDSTLGDIRRPRYITPRDITPRDITPRDSTPGDQPEVIEEEKYELQAGHVSKTTEIKGREGDQIELPGVRITILEEDVGGDEITVTARVHTKREAGFADIAPRIEFDPPVNFAKPVSMRMKTCLSAPIGEKILASLFTRDHPEDEWKEKEELSLKERNEVEFEIQRCSGIKVVVKNLEGKFHLISDFYIHSKTKRIVAVFTRDRVAHDLMEKDLLARNFFNLVGGPHEVVGSLGNEISLTMKCKKPKECKISDEVLPSASFTVNEKFIVKSAHPVYYKFEPEPTDECGRIDILYGCTVDGELDHSLPMTTELPLTDIKTEIRRGGNIIHNTFSNCLVNSTANQVAFGGGTNMSGAKNISGDVSTEVSAPVGQLATGNANITEQGTGNNYVAGSQENTDRSVTAGKAIYGESTSSSVGENITVHRSGK